MADRSRDRRAKIQVQAINPEGASLTVDEGGSFVDRCRSEMREHQGLEGACCCGAVMLCFFGSRLRRGDYWIQTLALLSVGECGPRFDGWTEVPWICGRWDTRLSQFWIQASCDQLYECWLSHWRIPGAKQPGVYCLIETYKVVEQYYNIIH